MTTAAPFTITPTEHIDLSSSSLTKFLKLADALGLTVRVQGTKAYVEAAYYLSKTKDHNIGDLKSEAKFVDCVFIVATNLVDFGVSATWHDGTFKDALVGGQRSGHRPDKLFTQITKLTEEIKRCMS